MKKLQEAIGKRVRIRYRNKPAYMTIFPDSREIFISSVHESDQKTMAGLDFACRCFSIVWQEAGEERARKQLEKSTRIPSDLPGIIKKELDRL